MDHWSVDSADSWHGPPGDGGDRRFSGRRLGLGEGRNRFLILEGGLHVLGPLQEEAARAAGGLAGGRDAAGAAILLKAEVNTMWLLLAVSVANIALGIW